MHTYIFKSTRTYTELDAAAAGTTTTTTTECIMTDAAAAAIRSIRNYFSPCAEATRHQKQKPKLLRTTLE